MEDYNCFPFDPTKTRVGTFIRSSYNELNRLNLAYMLLVKSCDNKGMKLLNDCSETVV